MLPLLTEATIEAMDISTDQCHPIHTYDDHNLFRQCGFTQQNIVVNTDNVKRDMEISNWKGSLKFVLLLTIVPLLQSMLPSDFDVLMVG